MNSSDSLFPMSDMRFGLSQSDVVAFLKPLGLVLEAMSRRRVGYVFTTSDLTH